MLKQKCIAGIKLVCGLSFVSNALFGLLISSSGILHLCLWEILTVFISYKVSLAGFGVMVFLALWNALEGSPFPSLLCEIGDISFFKVWWSYQERRPDLEFLCWEDSVLGLWFLLIAWEQFRFSFSSWFSGDKA